MKVRTGLIPGFSVVEIMVVMGVIAVLMGIALAGINSAQSFSRSQDRVNKAGQISEEIDDYLRSNGVLPSEGDGSLEWQQDEVVIGSNSIELKGFLQYTDSKTDAQKTHYKFVKTYGEYLVCVQQESGDWEGIGSGGDCVE